MNRVLFASLIFALVVCFAQLPASAGQSITVTLDVPQFGADNRSTPNHPDPDTNRSDSQPSAKATSRRVSDAVTIGRVGVITTPKASIYRSRTSGRILASCAQGTPIGIVGENGSWYGVLMVDSSTGWIKKSSIKLLNYDIVAANRSVPSGAGASSSGSGAVGEQVVQAALKYTGVPYVWGGNSWNGLDCSGFVKAVYSNFGVTLPRVSRDQASVGAPVSWDDLQAGDRLYFACKGSEIDHTGIYMGNGLFIHSSVRRRGVAVDNLTDGFFARSLVSARRS